MGAGVAGLRAAIELATIGEVLVVTKESVAESNTHYAQGGIAVAMEGDEDVSLHLKDTIGGGRWAGLRAGGQRCWWTEGPAARRRADRVGDAVRSRRGRSGADARRGALAGHEFCMRMAMPRARRSAARSWLCARAHKNIQFAEWTTVSDLVVARWARDRRRSSRPRAMHADGVNARAVLIAAGGAGQVYSDTTNPAVATGDGIALAAQAGAELADMEFYQFHPTAFSIDRVRHGSCCRRRCAAKVRYLRNDRGERFMERYHPLLELAPRDVVARAITREGMGERPGETRVVHLDMRHVRGVDLHKRFPGISAFLGTVWA